ncbi:MAG: NAD(P)-dependent oxidoreductase, partial [Pseudomonadota bacterium]
DVEKAALESFAEIGGHPASSAGKVIANSEVTLVALPSIAALESSIGGSQGMVSAAGPDHVICEMSTLSLAAKEQARSELAANGANLLDCPVSGTGAQAAEGDLVIYASGDEASFDKAHPVLDALGRKTTYVGEFGTGTKLKFVANLLVTIHNIAAGEALLLAERSGLELDMVYDAISSGAGTSRMFEVRGPMMVADNYEPATMKQDIFIKDVELILQHARETNTPTPLLAASLPIYLASLAQGRGKQDTASVFATLRKLAENITTKNQK